jgi:hypothetical protein
MDIVGAYELLKSEFSEAIVISAITQINQNGVYLYFDGMSSVSSTKDKASFVVVVAGNSLTGNANSALTLVADIRERLFKLGIKEAKNYFKGVKAAQFEGSTLFLYAVLLEIDIEIKRG